jgi:1-aminocyclopropane-1-carboxylate deaminase/D-cysteine desulfhydrase-like pyridoxal-dependent ACC family enzyme
MTQIALFLAVLRAFEAIKRNYSTAKRVSGNKALKLYYQVHNRFKESKGLNRKARGGRGTDHREVIAAMRAKGPDNREGIA